MKEAWQHNTSCLSLLPAEIVGIWEVCGESDFPIHVLHCHYVFGTFVLDFTCPVKKTNMKPRRVKNKANTMKTRSTQCWKHSETSFDYISHTVCVYSARQNLTYVCADSFGMQLRAASMFTHHCTGCMWCKKGRKPQVHSKITVPKLQ